MRKIEKEKKWKRIWKRGERNKRTKKERERERERDKGQGEGKRERKKVECQIIKVHN